MMHSNLINLSSKIMYCKTLKTFLCSSDVELSVWKHFLLEGNITLVILSQFSVLHCCTHRNSFFIHPEAIPMIWFVHLYSSIIIVLPHVCHQPIHKTSISAWCVLEMMCSRETDGRTGSQSPGTIWESLAPCQKKRTTNNNIQNPKEKAYACILFLHGDGTIPVCQLSISTLKPPPNDWPCVPSVSLDLMLLWHLLQSPPCLLKTSISAPAMEALHLSLLPPPHYLVVVVVLHRLASFHSYKTLRRWHPKARSNHITML